MRDNIEVGVAVPVAGFPLLPIIVLLGVAVMCAMIADIYLLKHQRLIDVNDLTRFHNRTNKKGSTTPLTTKKPLPPTVIPPPPSLANWCGHRTVRINDEIYKEEYDLTMVLPYVKQKDKYTVLYKVNLFIWVPINISLTHEAPFCSIFIFPQMEPRQAFIFDFEKWEQNANIARLLELKKTDRMSGPELANRATEGKKLKHFELDTLRNQTTSFKSFHAHFTLHLSTAMASLETCRNASGSCIEQTNTTVKMVHVGERMADAVFITLGQDATRGRGSRMVWQNSSQAVCCEVYRYDGPKLTKMCRINGTDDAHVCPEKETHDKCWDYGRGY